MITLENVSKRFEDVWAVDNVSLTMQEGSVFGLIGTNGAGKTTMLRMVTGIMRPDSGRILIDEKPVFNQEQAIREFYFIPDEPFFFRNATPRDMEKYLATVYEEFASLPFYEYLEKFGLPREKKISTFSKGMQKQLAIICGLCSNTKYLICDETFDGLDPVMRQGIKSILANHMDQRGLTPIIASHNLRELEDICDHIGLLHKGGVLLSKDLLDMKCNIQKIQCVFATEEEADKARQQMDILQMDKRGMLYTITARGPREEIMAYFAGLDTVFYEVLPLSLEEIFISETEVVGYDIKKIVFN
ncbi:MAG: ABC transporter ATP-binding protein [Lachnospiraceae bacterium]|nr:ABC transporter ATP-binding protein [Lachnospiraceae bacterium]